MSEDAILVSFITTRETAEGLEITVTSLVSSPIGHSIGSTLIATGKLFQSTFLVKGIGNSSPK